MVPKFGSIAGFVLDVQERLQPLGSQAFVRTGLRVAGFVEPVRGHTRFGHQVHAVGAELELHIQARRPDQGGVQRLVAVDFGNGNVVFEFARHRLEQLVQQTQSGVAGHGVFHDDPKAVNIGHLRKAQVFVVHLAVDGVERFFASGDAYFHARALENGFDLALYFVHQIAPAAAGAGDGFADDRMPPGQQVAEAQFFELAVGSVEAQSVGDRGVNVQRFLCDTLPLGARHLRHGAHIVGAVGQFDQDHAHVARHGQQHFAKRFGLGFLPAVELQPVQLGQPIHQFGHRRAEALDQLGLADATVFHGVVQQRRHQGLGIQVPIRALGGDRNRVGDVGRTVFSQLPQMHLIGKAVGQTHLLQIGGRQVAECRHQPAETRRDRVRGGAGKLVGSIRFAHTATVARTLAHRPDPVQAKKSTADGAFAGF